MTGHLRKALVMLSIFSWMVAPAAGEVIIQLHETPPEVTLTTPAEPGEAGGLFVRDKAGIPSSDVQLFPYEIDDTVSGGPTTLFSIRHSRDDSVPVAVTIALFDEFFVGISSEEVMLQENQLLSRNLRFTPDAVSPGAISRGVVQLIPDGTIASDYFLVDDAGNFATSEQGLTLSDFCQVWQSRFLRFGLDDLEGSKLLFILNGPRGNDIDMDPPSILGTVFDEAGNSINAFTVHTDRWLVEVNALDFVSGNTQFGSMIITLNTTISPFGAVFEKHSAFGKFSVGNLSFCRSPP